ncbi:MAG: hypothetical protein Hyperionvirus29_25 [Hyperionvirus sp.]|uniref:Chromosomal protein MC1 domain-containing protein n=1 Tax=Hyperionvirus sp. TaxID=2487770 RepID=A0A3G5ABQ0_9VIRU|nr:MAG: hypothetical protein Hyperionvirus29_25 [Hyperionvirus sp.]
MEEKNERKVRYFKCIHGTNTVGRYSGQTPKQAASKAFTKLYKEGYTYLNRPIVFKIYECTRNSMNQHHSYEGCRSELEHPLEVKYKSGESDKIVKYKFKNKITKLSRKESMDLPNECLSAA